MISLTDCLHDIFSNQILGKYNAFNFYPIEIIKQWFCLGSAKDVRHSRIMVVQVYSIIL